MKIQTLAYARHKNNVSQFQKQSVLMDGGA